jgi:hypothetical protein
VVVPRTNRVMRRPVTEQLHLGFCPSAAPKIRSPIASTPSSIPTYRRSAPMKSLRALPLRPPPVAARVSNRAARHRVRAASPPERHPASISFGPTMATSTCAVARRDHRSSPPARRAAPGRALSLRRTGTAQAAAITEALPHPSQAGVSATWRTLLPSRICAALRSRSRSTAVRAIGVPAPRRSASIHAARQSPSCTASLKDTALSDKKR